MYVSSRKKQKDQHLRGIVAANRATPHCVTNETPAFLMPGRKFNVATGEMGPPTRRYSTDYVSERENALRETYSVVKIVAAKEHRHSVGDMVCLKNKDKRQTTGLDIHHWLGSSCANSVISAERIGLSTWTSKRCAPWSSRQTFKIESERSWLR